MATRRTRKLGALIQAELAGLLLRKVKDPRLVGVSLTGVDVAPDLSQAKVFFSPLDPDKRGDAEAGFIKAAPFLRRELARLLNLKTMPRLVPVYDSSLARGAEMSELIKKVRAQDEAAARARGEEDGEGQA